MNKTILTLFLLATVPAMVFAGPDSREGRVPKTKASVEDLCCEGCLSVRQGRKDRPEVKCCPTCGRPEKPQGVKKDRPRRDGDDGEVRRERPRRDGDDGEVRREKIRKARAEKLAKKAAKRAPVETDDDCKD